MCARVAAIERMEEAGRRLDVARADLFAVGPYAVDPLVDRDASGGIGADDLRHSVDAGFACVGDEGGLGSEPIALVCGMPEVGLRGVAPRRALDAPHPVVAPLRTRRRTEILDVATGPGNELRRYIGNGLRIHRMLRAEHGAQAED